MSTSLSRICIVVTDSKTNPGYIVHYSREATTPDGEWYSETVKGEVTSVNIEGLSKGATFFFKVQAKNEEGLGPLSPTIMFTTEEGGVGFFLLKIFGKH